MKKQRFLLFSAFFSVILFASLVVSAKATKPVVDASVQDSAAMAYDTLMDSFSNPDVKSGGKIYPDSYGGAYINDDGQLVVYVTDETQTPEVLSDNPTVIYAPCTYSYNELQSIMDELNAYKANHPDDAIAANFNEFGLYDSENRVIVKLDDLSEERIEEFKENVCDSDAIVFQQGNGPVGTDANLNAGLKIFYSNGSASMGYRVKRNGVVGFVTAGHAANSVGKSIRYGSSTGTIFASCQATQQRGNADAAFCAITNSSYSPTNTLYGTSNVLSTTISEPGVGTVINKIGAATGHTSGKVVSTNVTVTFSNGSTISNLTAADYTSAPGDSGCVVYSYIGSTGARLTLGIHTGASSNGIRYFTKANEINAALGTSRY